MTKSIPLSPTIRPVRELNGVAAHVMDGKRLLHITDPAPTQAAAVAAAEAWCAGVVSVQPGRRKGWEEDVVERQSL